MYKKKPKPGAPSEVNESLKKAKSECTHCPINQTRQHTPPDQKLRPQRKFTIHTELNIICQYCHGQSSIQLGKQYNCTQDTIQNILRQYGKSPRTLRDAQLLRRGSEELTFPLSIEVAQLLNKPIVKSFIPHLIAIMLLTDGAAGYRQGHRPYITFTNKAESLHAIFADLIHHYYQQPPSAYFQEYWSKAGKQGHKAYYTTYNRKHDTQIMLNDLLKLSPIYRTRPKLGQPWEEYLLETPQPTIQFLFDSTIPTTIHNFIIQLAMSTEGTISPLFVRDSRFPYPHLTLACRHPLLKTEWKSYLETQGFSFNKTTEMIETAKLQMAKKLLKLGGFIKGVKVKISSYYHGFDKQAILKAIIIDRKNHPINPLLELDKKHKILRKRVEYFQEL